jgi:hypothetical protein
LVLFGITALILVIATRGTLDNQTEKQIKQTHEIAYPTTSCSYSRGDHMKAHRSSQIFLAVLLVASLACSFGVPEIPRIETGPTQTLQWSEDLPETDAVQDVSISIGFGEFTLTGGAKSLLESELQYNVPAWAPSVRRTADSLSVTQGEADYIVNGFPDKNVINIWNVRLGDIPMNLTLQADAYDAKLDLSGLPLRKFTVQDGASQSEVRFDSLNPEEMQSLTYQTGASEIRFHGLANANFAQMTFDGGAGDYTFDFSGELQQDATVKIKVGLSSVRIIVPAGVSAQVFANSGVGNISASGAWQEADGGYVNEGDGPQVTITVDVGAGELKLVNQ